MALCSMAVADLSWQPFGLCCSIWRTSLTSRMSGLSGSQVGMRARKNALRWWKKSDRLHHPHKQYKWCAICQFVFQQRMTCALLLSWGFSIVDSSDILWHSGELNASRNNWGHRCQFRVETRTHTAEICQQRTEAIRYTSPVKFSSHASVSYACKQA